MVYSGDSVCVLINSAMFYFKEKYTNSTLTNVIAMVFIMDLQLLRSKLVLKGSKWVSEKSPSLSAERPDTTLHLRHTYLI